MNKDLELVLEQCKGVVDREIPLLVLAPEYTKILLDYIEKIQQENELLKEKIDKTIKYMENYISVEEYNEPVKCEFSIIIRLLGGKE